LQHVIDPALRQALLGAQVSEPDVFALYQGQPNRPGGHERFWIGASRWVQ
jgi:hypothetical protein